MALFSQDLFSVFGTESAKRPAPQSTSCKCMPRIFNLILVIVAREPPQKKHRIEQSATPDASRQSKAQTPRLNVEFPKPKTCVHEV